MKFKVHEDGHAEIFFSEREIETIKDKKQLVCDRILHTPFSYSFNYCFGFNSIFI